MRILPAAATTAALLPVLLIPVAPAQAAALDVRWTAGDEHGQATVHSDLRGLKVCDGKNDGYTVAIKWGWSVWMLGWRSGDYRSLRAPQGGCASYRWDPSGKLFSRVTWAAYCVSPRPGQPTRCGARKSFPDAI